MNARYSNFEGASSGSHENRTMELLSGILSEIGSTKQLLDVYKDWLVKSGPIRLALEAIRLVLSWERVDSTVLSFMLLSLMMYVSESLASLGFVLSLIGFQYLRLLVRFGIASPPKPGSVDIQENMKFNNFAMRSWCELHDYLLSIPDVELSEMLIYFAMPSILVTFLIPIRFLVLSCTSFYLLLQLRRKLTTEAQKQHRSVQTLTGKSSHTFEVYENQRWWLTGWSDHILSLSLHDVYPWSDATGIHSFSKATIDLPSQEWSWEGPWHIDDNGWMYAGNFSPHELRYHARVSSLDFVRRRRWIRHASIQ